MYLDSIIHPYLISQTAITALVGDSPDGGPAIFNDNKIPSDFKYKNSKGSVNYYNNQPFDGGKKIPVEYFVLNCRAKDKPKSQALAKAVYLKLNRVGLDGNTFGHASILPTIPPEDETDVYNTPVQAKIINRIGV